MHSKSLYSLVPMMILLQTVPKEIDVKQLKEDLIGMAKESYQVS